MSSGSLAGGGGAAERDAMLALALLAVLAPVGCIPCPPDGGLSKTFYGFGSVSVVLSAVEGADGVVGVGSTPGWDPDAVDEPGLPLTGGYFSHGSGGLVRSRDYGSACMALQRTDTFDCAANTLCIEWGQQIDGTSWVGAQLIDVEDGLEGTRSSSESAGQGDISFVRDSVASGHLTVAPLVWNLGQPRGDADCGTDAVALDWAFDESQPVDVLAPPTECNFR